MLKPILRRLKHWALHHLGITTILDMERAVRGEILESRQQTADTMLGLEQRIALMGQSSEERAARLAQDITEAVRGQITALERELSQVAGGCDQMRTQAAALEQAVARLESAVFRESSESATRMDQIVGTLGHARGTLDQIAAWDLGSLNLDRWRIQENEGLLRYLRKKDYLQAIQEGHLAVPELDTNHPIAVTSIDTLHPRGAKNDNSICLRFNRKLYDLFGGRRSLKVLDLGCAGGGFVRSLLDDGHFAVGLEGSDYPVTHQVGEWATIPHHLQTCDVTRPFRLTDSATGEPIRFDAITAWEVMEHIPEDSLPGLLDNVERHLVPGGYLLFSVATFVDAEDGVIWHVTVRSRDWWIERFGEAGFAVDASHPFGKNDWLRGAGNCRGDWHEDQDMGFHLVLRRKADLQAAGPAAAAA